MYLIRAFSRFLSLRPSVEKRMGMVLILDLLHFTFVSTLEISSQLILFFKNSAMTL
jgi:hypothetical protein